MNAIKKQAHIAGVLYILASIAAVFAWIYVGGKIFVRDDATATANNIWGAKVKPIPATAG